MLREYSMQVRRNIIIISWYVCEFDVLGCMCAHDASSKRRTGLRPNANCHIHSAHARATPFDGVGCIGRVAVACIGRVAVACIGRVAVACNRLGVPYAFGPGQETPELGLARQMKLPNPTR